MYSGGSPGVLASAFDGSIGGMGRALQDCSRKWPSAAAYFCQEAMGFLF